MAWLHIQCAEWKWLVQECCDQDVFVSHPTDWKEMKGILFKRRSSCNAHFWMFACSQSQELLLQFPVQHGTAKERLVAVSTFFLMLPLEKPGWFSFGLFVIHLSSKDSLDFLVLFKAPGSDEYRLIMQRTFCFLHARPQRRSSYWTPWNYTSTLFLIACKVSRCFWRNVQAEDVWGSQQNLRARVAPLAWLVDGEVLEQNGNLEAWG